MGYIKQFYDKPSHLTWEVFYKQVNSEFKIKQEQSLAKIAEKRKNREENERKKQLQIEKDKQNKEQQDKLALQQKLQVQQQLKNEQEQREQRERNRVEEAQRLAKIEEEKKHNETKKAVEKIADSAVTDFLDLDDDNEEEEEVPANGKPVGVDLSNVKKEKDEKTDPKTEAKSKEELFEKIFDLNQADYRIALKNYDLNKSLEAYLQQVGGLVMDPDVLHALRNLKELGRSMRCAKGGDETVSQANNSGLLSVGVSVNPNGQCPRELFPEKSPSFDTSQLATEIKQENTSDQNILPSNSALVSPPPPGRMFPGLKRQTTETFNESISAKKKKGTPGRKNIISPVTSPLHCQNSVDECILKLTPCAN